MKTEKGQPGYIKTKKQQPLPITKLLISVTNMELSKTFRSTTLRNYLPENMLIFIPQSHFRLVLYSILLLGIIHKADI